MKTDKKKIFIHLDSGRGYSRQLLQGIYEYNNQFTNWDIIFQSASYQQPEDYSKVNIEIIKAYKPNGCILAYSKNIKEILNLDIPVIQTNSININEWVPYIKGNYDADGKLAVEYFRSIGFENIGFFGVNNLSWSRGRLESVEKHCRRFNIRFFVFDYITNLENVYLEKNLNKLIKWLKYLPKPIGILACNDDFGKVLINACTMADIAVPHEIAVLGVDNDELICNITFPNMSSISRNMKETASSICLLLSRMMSGEKHLNTIIPTEPSGIVVRQSTDTIATIDEEVIKAIKFIREHSSSFITVDDVVKSTHLGKRRLYARFKKVTGRSINDEIQSFRLQYFKRLLKETNQSIKEIAFQLGFEDTTHISRWFKSIEGTSPTKWRNR